MLFLLGLFLLGVFTGGLAAVVGFGIGSFLTPVLALKTTFGSAVAAVGIAHFFGSAVRFWLLKSYVNRKILLSFGVLSAVGGLAGALLQGRASSTILSVTFGFLMMFAGVSGLVGWTKNVKIRGVWAWLLGAASGFFGGLVGNQGGLRAAGLTGFHLKKTEFVATATAVALFVDLLRTPVYLIFRAHELRQLMAEIILMSSGVIIGTILGAPLLRRLPDKFFRALLSLALIIVGALLISKI